MHKSKLIDLLKNLTPKELEELQQYISSPFFNNNEEICLLTHTILQYAPKFKHKKLEKQQVFKQAFPKEQYDEKKISYLMHYMLKLTEEYLSYREYQGDTLRRQYYLLRTYNDRGLQKHYNGALREAQKLQSKRPAKDFDYFYYNYLFEAVNNEHFDKQMVHKYDDSLQKAIDNLDHAYLTMKLKYSCEILNRQNLMTTDYQLKLLDVILHYLEESPALESPLVNMYYHLLMLMLERNPDAHYKQLKELMKSKTRELPQDEARDIYVFTQNFCIRKINKGDNTYLNELFDQYKIMIENDILFTERYLSPWSYKNIVGVAIRVGDYNWAEGFIYDYKDKLAPKHRDNALTYNLASLYFNQNDYEKAQQMLSQVEFTDIVYNLGAKSMLLRIYYELEESDALFSLLIAFKNYLRRNKFISDYQRTVHINLVQFVMDLIKIPNSQPEEARKLYKEIEETKQVAYIKWLLEKVDQVANRKKRA